AFEERERLMEFYERVSGARMHAVFIRPGGLSMDVPLGLFDDINRFVETFLPRMFDIEELLSRNRIWKQRLVDIGLVSKYDAIDHGFSGVMLGGSGLDWDLRTFQIYEVYDLISYFVHSGLIIYYFEFYLFVIDYFFVS